MKIPIDERRSVLQDWVMRLPFMQQSVLLTAVRGPDGMRKWHPVKPMVAQFRRAIMIHALERRVILDPYEKCIGSFTGALDRKEFPERDDVLLEYQYYTDEIPHHFQLHFMHASEILGYKHDDEVTRDWWAKVYRILVRDMHLFPETEKQMDKRLGDDVDGWLAASPDIERESNKPR